MTSDLKQKAVRSVGWLAIQKGVNVLLSVTVSTLLARLVAPEAYGLIGMLAAFLGLIALFQEIGLSAAVIQRQDVTEEQLSTVFAINVVSGVTLFALTWLVSPLIAAFYHEPRLTFIARLIALNFVFTSFGSLQGTLLAKALDFKKITLIRAGVAVTSGVAAVVMAFRGWGVYALVFQNLTQEFLSTVVTWLVVRWVPRVRPRLASARGLLRFGVNILGFELVNFVRSNADYLLLGRYIGAGPLGIYMLANTVMRLVSNQVGSLLSQVAFPLFSTVQHDKARIRRGLLQMVGLMALISMPIMIGIMLVAPEAMRVVLGQKWHKWERAIFLIQVLAPMGAIQSLGCMNYSIFKAQGRVALLFRYSILSTAVSVTAFVIGLRWDIEGVTVVSVLAQLLLLPISYYLIFGMLEMSFGEFFGAIRTPLVATAAMMIVVGTYRELAFRVLGWPNVAVLCTEIAFGAAVYALVLRAINPQTYTDLLGLVRMLTGGARPTAAPAVVQGQPGVPE